MHQQLTSWQTHSLVFKMKRQGSVQASRLWDEPNLSVWEEALGLYDLCIQARHTALNSKAKKKKPQKDQLKVFFIVYISNFAEES